MKIINKKYGIGITSTLGLIFIVLKLIDIIDWSWWWVLFPFYGVYILFSAIILLLAAYAKILLLCKDIKQWQKKRKKK